MADQSKYKIPRGVCYLCLRRNLALVSRGRCSTCWRRQEGLVQHKGRNVKFASLTPEQQAIVMLREHQGMRTPVEHLWPLEAMPPTTEEPPKPE